MFTLFTDEGEAAVGDLHRAVSHPAEVTTDTEELVPDSVVLHHQADAVAQAITVHICVMELVIYCPLQLVTGIQCIKTFCMKYLNTNYVTL